MVGTTPMQPNTRNRKKELSTDKPATIVIDYAYWCPECEEVTTIKMGDIDYVHARQNNDDDPEVLADGGRDVTPGDRVEYDGETYRVARANSSQCEIYQLDDVAQIVSLAEVEPHPVPEVQG